MTKFIKVDISKVTEPANGAKVYKNYYWCHNDGKVLFYNNGKNVTPQCNMNRSVVEFLTSIHSYDQYEPLLIDVAYVVEDYKRWVAWTISGETEEDRS